MNSKVCPEHRSMLHLYPGTVRPRRSAYDTLPHLLVLQMLIIILLQRRIAHDAVLERRVLAARHIRPVPLERHRHLPQILGHEWLLEAVDVEGRVHLVAVRVALDVGEGRHATGAVVGRHVFAPVGEVCCPVLRARRAVGHWCAVGALWVHGVL